MNGNKGRCPIKVKNFFYPEEFKYSKEEASNYDFGVLELEEELEETNGYVGIDAREVNTEGV